MGRKKQGDLPGQRPPALSPPALCDSAERPWAGCPLVAPQQHTALGEPCCTYVLSLAGRQPDFSSRRPAQLARWGGWRREGGSLGSGVACQPHPRGTDVVVGSERRLGLGTAPPSGGDHSCHRILQVRRQAPRRGRRWGTRPRWPSLRPELHRSQAPGRARLDPSEVLNHPAQWQPLPLVPDVS